MISRFHYLTQDLPGISHTDLIKIACKNGIKWVQLRVKNKPFDEWLSIAIEARKITKEQDVKLIINDDPQIALESKADGVHLGKSDMDILEARNILGEKAIIGGTANTFEDIKILTEKKADYIGVGPYNFTKTKEKLSPVLGLEGYIALIKKCKYLNIKTPLIAIGGIAPEDVELLMKTGLYGIAVSSTINLAENKEVMINSFLEKVYNQKILAKFA